MNERLPHAWTLAYFGMFRGRPNSPLRVSGYLDAKEAQACPDPIRLKGVFDTVGFTSHAPEMLEQASTPPSTGQATAPTQFDAYPEGTLGDTFSFDSSYQIQRPELVPQNFEGG
jgi:hypothetical protein